MPELNICYAHKVSDYDNILGKLRKTHNGEFIHFIFRQRDRSMQGMDLLIAKKQNEQIGIARRSLKYDKVHDRKYLFIDFIYILPEYRGLGYSSLLFKQSLIFGKNKYVRLKILNGEQNIPAYCLYTKHGFEWYDKSLNIMHLQV